MRDGPLVALAVAALALALGLVVGAYLLVRLGETFVDGLRGAAAGDEP